VNKVSGDGFSLLGMLNQGDKMQVQATVVCCNHNQDTSVGFSKDCPHCTGRCSACAQASWVVIDRTECSCVEPEQGHGQGAYVLMGPYPSLQDAMLAWDSDLAESLQQECCFDCFAIQAGESADFLQDLPLEFQLVDLGDPSHTAKE
jgi:hypothetical protein